MNASAARWSRSHYDNNSCLWFAWITLNHQHVIFCECQCGKGGGSDIENISCSGFIWCLSRDILWMPVFKNYWGNGLDCCSMEKSVRKAFVEPHLVVQAKVVGRLLKERSSLTSQKFSLASCLMCACKRGHVKVIKFILSAPPLPSPVSINTMWAIREFLLSAFISIITIII